MTMQFRAYSLLSMLLFAVSPAVHADGCYIPRVQLDPNSHARDITEPTQKAVLAHFNGHERLILQVSYKGDASEFAWLVPTPARPTLSKFDDPIFHQLRLATAPTVNYWFDADRLLHEGMWMFAGSRGKSIGASVAAPPQVEVLERKQIGFYDIAVLRARDANDLVTWLRMNHYTVIPRITSVLDDYICRGWVFTAARIKTVDQAQAKNRLSEGVLQSIQLDFPSAKPIYPLKISSLNPGRTEILIYAVSEHRLTAPGFKTSCVLGAGPYGVQYRLRGAVDDMIGAGPLSPQTALLTKLVGEFNSSDMTSDLELVRAISDVLVDRPTVSPPFLENLGALSLLVFATPFVLPFSIVTLLVSLVAGCTRWGERHIGAWRTAAYGAIVLPVPLLMLTQRVGYEAHYWPFGLAAMCGLILAAVILLLGRRRAQRRRAT